MHIPERSLRNGKVQYKSNGFRAGDEYAAFNKVPDECLKSETPTRYDISHPKYRIIQESKVCYLVFRTGTPRFVSAHSTINDVVAITSHKNVQELVIPTVIYTL